MHETTGYSKEMPVLFMPQSWAKLLAAHPRPSFFLVSQEGSLWGRRWPSGQRDKSQGADRRVKLCL